VRVLLTGTAEQCERLAARLRGSGLAPVACPLVETTTLGGGPVRVESYEWLVLTSRSGVDALFERLEGPLPPVAVVGPGTAEALRGRGVEPALVAAPSTQEGLLACLPRPAGRVLFAGAEDARRLLVEELCADFLPLYRTVTRRVGRPPDADLAVVASASAARALAALERRLPCVSIGPQTSTAARADGLDVVAEAASSDLDGLVAAITLAASRLASSRS
jgi:uroporphyrinogen III methyltransferase/synthase